MNSKKGSSDSSAHGVGESPVFRVRLGKPQLAPQPKLKTFIGRIRAMVREQGGVRQGRRSRGGRGGSAAARLPVRASPQRVAIKTRVINHGKFRRAGGALKALQGEVAYLKRRGASEDGEMGIAFDSHGSLTGEDLQAFRARMAPDRHHFRVMISAEKGAELDLPEYTREVVTAIQKDLSTRLEWFGVAHYDTDNPHVHLVVRGKDDQGRDLVISRDYISHGMRLQAGEIATQRLGPRRAQDIEQSLARDLTAERVTALDRTLDRHRAEHPDGWVSALHGRTGDLARESERVRTLARLQHLESLGLAREIAPGIWQPDPNLLKKLKALSLRGDIVKTIHSRMTDKPYELDPLILDADHPPRETLIGRVTARGRVDEFWDDEYVLLDTHKGRTAYVPLTGATLRGEPTVGTLVQVGSSAGTRWMSSLGDELAPLIKQHGVTALDQQLSQVGVIGFQKTILPGFAGDYQRALQGRVAYLKEAGLASREGSRWRLQSGFLDQLYSLELNAAEERLRARFGDRRSLSEGASWRGTVSHIEELPSGPHAVVAEAGRYVLIPAAPELERALHRSVALTVKTPSAPSFLEPLGRRWTFEVVTLKRVRGLKL